jgi:hypothetical protein
MSKWITALLITIKELWEEQFQSTEVSYSNATTLSRTQFSSTIQPQVLGVLCLMTAMNLKF